MAQQPAARARRLKERVQAFSARYAQARGKFLEGAAAAGLRIESHMHPLKGRDGETLAMDIALAGKPDAASLLIVSSGCHGVEGYCGSGVQVFALHDQEWRDKVSSSAVAACAAESLSTAVADGGLRCAPSRVRLRSPTTPRRPRETPSHALMQAAIRARWRSAHRPSRASRRRSGCRPARTGWTGWAPSSTRHPRS